MERNKERKESKSERNYTGIQLTRGKNVEKKGGRFYQEKGLSVEKKEGKNANYQVVRIGRREEGKKDERKEGKREGGREEREIGRKEGRNERTKENSAMR